MRRGTPQSEMSDPTTDAPDGEDPSSRSLVSRLFAALSPETPGPSQANGAVQPGIGNLSSQRVDDVAIPRAEIRAVPVDASLDDVLQAFRETQYTRLPVFEGTLDQPVGLIHFKDLALRHGFGASGTFDLAKELRPVLFAPPSMPIGVLLQKMQADRTHMALVIDEYGGVDGLVTLEDVIEQVIGEIEDEHDQLEGALWAEEGRGVFLAQARAPLDEFGEAAGVQLMPEDGDEGEIDTLGGLVFLLTGRVPARGEVVPHPSGAEIEVVDADPRRIKRVRVRLPAAAARASAARAARAAAAPGE